MSELHMSPSATCTMACGHCAFMRLQLLSKPPPLRMPSPESRRPSSAPPKMRMTNPSPPPSPKSQVGTPTFPQDIDTTTYDPEEDPRRSIPGPVEPSKSFIGLPDKGKQFSDMLVKIAAGVPLDFLIDMHNASKPESAPVLTACELIRHMARGCANSRAIPDVEIAVARADVLSKPYDLDGKEAVLATGPDGWMGLVKKSLAEQYPLEVDAFDDLGEEEEEFPEPSEIVDHSPIIDMDTVEQNIDDGNQAAAPETTAATTLTRAQKTAAEKGLVVDTLPEAPLTPPKTKSAETTTTKSKVQHQVAGSRFSVLDIESSEDEANERNSPVKESSSLPPAATDQPAPTKAKKNRKRKNNKKKKAVDVATVAMGKDDKSEDTSEKEAAIDSDKVTTAGTDMGDTDAETIKEKIGMLFKVVRGCVVEGIGMLVKDVRELMVTGKLSDSQYPGYLGWIIAVAPLLLALALLLAKYV